MQREWLAEEDLLDEVTTSMPSEEGLGQVCRHILLKLILAWTILMLLSYQFHLLNDKQILSHPVEAFICDTGLAVHTVTVGVTVELANVRTFSDLKSQLIRAGRLMGVATDAGVLDARIESDRHVLSWTATDRKGRHNAITGAIIHNGVAQLEMEMTTWGPESKIKDTNTEILLVGARFGKVRSSRIQVEGLLDISQDVSPEKWVQTLRLVDLKVTKAGSAVKLQGVTPDLAQGRRKPVAFTLSLVPDGHTKGRMALSVENQ